MRLGCASQTPTFQSLPVPSRWPRRLEKPPWNWICSWETRMRWGNSSITHWERPWKQTGKPRLTITCSEPCYACLIHSRWWWGWEALAHVRSLRGQLDCAAGMLLSSQGTLDPCI